ncbi:MAG: hypothetical protein ACT4OJ_10065 [Bacteroidota bacterium]
MKYTKGIAVVLSASLFFSCGNSAGETTDTGPVPSSSVQNTAGNSGLSADTTKLPGITTPVSINAVPNTTARLNPAHGQPGHRCDIAVGAPLDGKPASTEVSNAPPAITQPATPITINQNPTGVTAVPVTPAATTAPGMNPPHGQPGHRCDIAVGAPLDSKPGNPPATVTPTPIVTPVTSRSSPADASSTAPLINPDAAPVKSDAAAPVKTEPVVVAPGMNPAHGQPGHRCDIAVGAPLDSKPTGKKDN